MQSLRGCWIGARCMFLRARACMLRRVDCVDACIHGPECFLHSQSNALAHHDTYTNKVLREKLRILEEREQLKSKLRELELEKEIENELRTQENGAPERKSRTSKRGTRQLSSPKDDAYEDDSDDREHQGPVVECDIGFSVRDIGFVQSDSVMFLGGPGSVSWRTY